MKSLKTSLLGVFVLVLLLPTVYNRVAHSQDKKGDPPTGQANVALSSADLERPCPIDTETPACQICPAPTEAPTGFDDQTNDPNFVSQTDHDKHRATFEVRDQILPDDIQDGGLGPVYNAQSCAECHQNPVSGAVSQINELRAGFLDNPCDPQGFDCLQFVDPPGGSLINDRAVDRRVNPTIIQANIQERVPPLHSAAGPQPILDRTADVTTTRTSLNLLGDGFVEAISNQTLLDLVAKETNENPNVHGMTTRVPIEENRNDRCRIGRFGHKDQHASLLSFSGDAYLNEIGITNRFFLMENTSLGRSVANFDFVPNDPNLPCDDTVTPPGQRTFCGEDAERDIDVFTIFMRATKAPPRDAVIAASQDALDGAKMFKQDGCNICHRDTITTAMPGTVINLGTFTVPNALGNKIIHPFGDFLLHDIDTGDGIVQNGGQPTRLLVRTAPLWGVRTHTRLMHDGASLTFEQAIKRHGHEALFAKTNFFNRPASEQRKIVVFLESL
ncbi:MAG: di-heme oxidoredictase family protein [Pyrinomonadaceae bacterium]